MKEFADEVKFIGGLQGLDWFMGFWKECAFGIGKCQGTFWGCLLVWKRFIL